MTTRITIQGAQNVVGLTGLPHQETGASASGNERRADAHAPHHSEAAHASERARAKSAYVLRVHLRLALMQITFRKSQSRLSKLKSSEGYLKRGWAC